MIINTNTDIVMKIVTDIASKFDILSYNDTMSHRLIGIRIVFGNL